MRNLSIGTVVLVTQVVNGKKQGAEINTKQKTPFFESSTLTCQKSPILQWIVTQQVETPESIS